MKLKKIFIYFILITIIPFITLFSINEKYQNFNSLKINLNYMSLADQHLNDFFITAVLEGIEEIYNEILIIDGINKSKEPRSKIIEMDYSEFKFDTDNDKEIDEKKIEKLIQNKIIDIIKIHKLVNSELKKKCTKYSNFPETCNTISWKSSNQNFPKITQYGFKLDKTNGIVIKKFKKINKVNLISLSLVISIIIMLLIEIILKKKIIFKRILKLFI